LRTLAFKNDDNKNQIVECNALPTLILMLGSEDAAIHYEAVRNLFIINCFATYLSMWD
jgi:hypothetical protein